VEAKGSGTRSIWPGQRKSESRQVEGPLVNLDDDRWPISTRARSSYDNLHTERKQYIERYSTGTRKGTYLSRRLLACRFYPGR
jgi:hypothetical protein